jgi:hypothetical protein
VWYALTTPANRLVTANTFGSGYDTTLTVFSGVRGSLVEVMCNDDYNGSLQSQISFTAYAGVPYHFMVNSYGTTAGQLVFNVQQTTLPPPPPNDNFTNATSITSLPYTNSVNTSGATSGPEDVYACNYPNYSVWYAFRPTQGGQVSVSTVGSDYMTTLAVLTGAPGKFNSIACGSAQTSFSAIAGVTYYFEVGSYYSSSAGNLVLTVTEVPAPPNDSITNATRITSLPYTNQISTAGATTGPEDLSYCYYYLYNTVWYSLTPSQSGRIGFSTAGSDYTALVNVFKGAPGALQVASCGTNFDAVAGQTYYFMVGSYNYNYASNLVFSVIEIFPPTNDDIGNATAITSLPATYTLDTELATRAPDDPISCGDPNGPTVWYSLTPAQDEFVQFSLPPTNVYYNWLSVYTGSRGSLTPVACANYGLLGFKALAGQTYYVMLNSPQGGSVFTFSARSFPLLNATVTVDSVETVDSKTGLVTVSGTVSSSQPVTFGLAGTLRQTSGRHYLVTASFGQNGALIVDCPGQATWSVQLLGDTGSFGSGAALLSLEASAYEPVSGQSANMQSMNSIQLRGKAK